MGLPRCPRDVGLKRREVCGQGLPPVSRGDVCLAAGVPPSTALFFYGSMPVE